MSEWTVNADWSDFLPPDLGPVTRVTVEDELVDLAIDPRDALAAPDVEDLLGAGLALLPQGAAWGTPDGEAASTTSVFAGLMRALLAPFATLYARAWQVSDESRAAAIVDSLDQWEADFALPEPCVTGAQTDAERRLAVRVKALRLATITPADVVELAARLGFIVAVEEPAAFLAGESACLGLGELSDTSLESQWVVHVRDVPATQFEAGIGEAGVTRLLDFEIGVLACAIKRIAPAWTYPFVSVAPLPRMAALGTETGAVLATETGRLIFVRLPA